MENPENVQEEEKSPLLIADRNVAFVIVYNHKMMYLDPKDADPTTTTSPTTGTTATSTSTREGENDDGCEPRKSPITLEASTSRRHASVKRMDAATIQ